MTTQTFEVQVIEMLNDLVNKVSRLETRLMRLADELGIDVKKPEKKHVDTQ